MSISLPRRSVKFSVCGRGAERRSGIINLIGLARFKCGMDGKKRKCRCMSFGYWIRITNAERKREKREEWSRKGRNQETTPPKQKDKIKNRAKKEGDCA